MRLARRDMPYFVAETLPDKEGLTLTLVHATVEMTQACNLCNPPVNSLTTIDTYLYLKGELLSEAARIAQEEEVEK